MDEYYTKIRNSLITSQNLTDLEFRILCLLMAMSDKNGACFPSIRTIAKLLNKSPVSINNSLKRLEFNKYIFKKNRAIGTGKKTSNIYTINVSCMPFSLGCQTIGKNLKSLKGEETDQLNQEFLDVDWLDENYE